MGASGWLAYLALHPATLIAVGSAAGGNLRFWLGAWVHARQWPGGLPWGTILINVSGSFLVGLFAAAFLERLDPGRREAYLLLGTGFCGGYTTFSAFELETYRLVRDGHWPAALANVGVSVAAGLLAVALGVALGHQIFGRDGG